MKVLFYCNGNVGRSQMAEALFNKLSRKNTAFSAGLEGGKRGHQMLGEKAPDVTKVMGELGIDVSKNRPKQLTEEMTKEANLIINLAPEKPVPDFIDRNKMVIWHVEDGKGKSYDIVVKIRDQIKRHVEELVAEIG